MTEAPVLGEVGVLKVSEGHGTNTVRMGVSWPATPSCPETELLANRTSMSQKTSSSPQSNFCSPTKSGDSGFSDSDSSCLSSPCRVRKPRHISRVYLQGSTRKEQHYLQGSGRKEEHYLQGSSRKEHYLQGSSRQEEQHLQWSSRKEEHYLQGSSSKEEQHLQGSSRQKEQDLQGSSRKEKHHPIITEEDYQIHSSNQEELYQSTFSRQEEPYHRPSSGQVKYDSYSSCMDKSCSSMQKEQHKNPSSGQEEHQQSLSPLHVNISDSFTQTPEKSKRRTGRLRRFFREGEGGEGGLEVARRIRVSSSRSSGAASIDSDSDGDSLRTTSDEDPIGIVMSLNLQPPALPAWNVGVSASTASSTLSTSTTVSELSESSSFSSSSVSSQHSSKPLPK